MTDALSDAETIRRRAQECLERAKTAATAEEKANCEKMARDFLKIAGQADE